MSTIREYINSKTIDKNTYGDVRDVLRSKASESASPDSHEYNVIKAYTYAFAYLCSLKNEFGNCIDIASDDAESVSATIREWVDIWHSKFKVVLSTGHQMHVLTECAVGNKRIMDGTDLYQNICSGSKKMFSGKDADGDTRFIPSDKIEYAYFPHTNYDLRSVIEANIKQRYVTFRERMV